ncbi:MAG: PDZ domain-containing protein [Nitrospirae bacterium]|nr:PDZ domain-containing protein [Nitrospirota bacterium]
MPERKNTLTRTSRGDSQRISIIKNINNYAPILEKNPFGQPMKLILQTEGRTEMAQAIPSSLILIGTVVGAKKLSYAIFEDKSRPDIQKQEVFAYGKRVYGYGILTKIERGWVEITQDTGAYRIPLTDVKLTEVEAKTQSSSIRKIRDNEYLIDQRGVQSALNNPEQILKDARLLPNIRDGKQEGFNISEVKPGGLYDSMGLRNGDTLLKVNGLEMSTPEHAMQAMSALRGMDRVTLDIIRDNSKTTMTYQIR